MEKITKGLVLSGCICCLAGAGLLGAGYVSDGWDYVKAADINQMDGGATLDNARGVKKDRILLERISSVDAEIGDFDFEIRRSEDENYYLSYCLKEEKGELPMTWEVEQGKLKLRKKEHFYFLQIQIPWVGTQITEEQAVLYVPEGAVLENCKISVNDNDLVLEDLSCNAIELKQHYGEMEIRNCEFGQGTISLSDGTMEAEDFCFRNTIFDLHDNDMELKRGILDSAKLKLSDGDLEAEELELQNEITVDGHYANLDLELKKGQEEQVSLMLDTRDGDIEVDPKYYGALSASEDNDRARFEYHAAREGAVLKADLADGSIEID